MGPFTLQGMGEPLNNYNAVKAAVALMTDSRVFGLRRQKVTVSTVGVVPRVLQAGLPSDASQIAPQLLSVTQGTQDALGCVPN